MPSTPTDSKEVAQPMPPQAPWCLFLDIDGTLLDIAPTPDAVKVDVALLNLLRRLGRACNGAIALVTGRSIAAVDALFDPLQLPVAGVHGFERRNAQGRHFRPDFVGAGLSYLRSEVTALAQSLHGVLLEDKGCAFAVHYRQAPNLEETVRLRLARLVSAALPAFELLDGDHVVEIKPAEHDKSSAIEAFMQEKPFTGRTPVFIGDDTTDLDGFAAMKRFNGLAIAVGSRIPGDMRLAGPRDVRAWLEGLLTA
jgi:trehalose 6-phosphate phosphatase